MRPCKRTARPVCWGSNSFGEASPPSDERFKAISSGSWHTCALRFDGTPVCWGLVDDSDHGGPLPMDFGQERPPEGERFVAISSGDFHSCGIRADGTPVCWGVDTSPAEDIFSAIDSGDRQACGLREDGSVSCWGPARKNPRSDERFTFISASNKVCGLREDGSIILLVGRLSWRPNFRRAITNS